MLMRLIQAPVSWQPQHQTGSARDDAKRKTQAIVRVRRLDFTQQRGFQAEGRGLRKPCRDAYERWLLGWAGIRGARLHLAGFVYVRAPIRGIAARGIFC